MNQTPLTPFPPTTELHAAVLLAAITLGLAALCFSGWAMLASPGAPFTQSFPQDRRPFGTQDTTIKDTTRKVPLRQAFDPGQKKVDPRRIARHIDQKSATAENTSPEAPHRLGERLGREPFCQAVEQAQLVQEIAAGADRR